MKCRWCGCEQDDKAKPRSVEQLRRFFAVLKAMHHHWPEKHEFQPHDEEHLRKWVLCKAGHRTIVNTLTLPKMAQDTLEQVKSVINIVLEADNRFPRWKGNTVASYEAKSINFHTLGQAAFNKLNDEVEAVYAAETGLDPEQVLKNHEGAA